MKKGKVKQVQSNGTWEGNYGMMYKFEVTFENGDCGEYSSKSEQQTKFIEGEETEYEFTGGKFPKVKPYYAPPSSGGQSYYKKDDNIQNLIVRQSSIKCATELASAYINQGHTITVGDATKMAQEICDWVKEDVKETKTKENDLPF